MKNGVFRAIYLPANLDKLVEKARKRLGMNRSRFYQYCITKILQEISILSTAVHDVQEGDGRDE